MKELFETRKYFFAGDNAMFSPFNLTHASMVLHHNKEIVGI